MKSEKSVKIGDLILGGNNPIRVQTMYDSKISMSDVDSVVERLYSLKALGMDIMRFAFLSEDESEIFKEINRRSPVPTVADIHFDYNLALAALDSGFSKIRINPGNIGSKERVSEIVKKARDLGKAIRIGINGASLPSGINEDPKSMANLAMDYVSDFERLGFHDIVVSIKSSSERITIESNRELGKICPYPIHLGVTEAGSLIPSIVKTTYSLSTLLSEGIGSTIRYSITGDILSEVIAGSELLRTLNLRDDGIRIISCPRCSRNTFDTQSFLKEVEIPLRLIKKNLTVAIMGCLVNGPGEAKKADIAITGLNDRIYLYKKGKIIGVVDRERAKEALFEALNE